MLISRRTVDQLLIPTGHPRRHLVVDREHRVQRHLRGVGHDGDGRCGARRARGTAPRGDWSRRTRTRSTSLRTLRPDFVFNIAEGLHGVSREAQIPAMLEMLQIPYLGSDPLTLRHVSRQVAREGDSLATTGSRLRRSPSSTRWKSSTRCASPVSRRSSSRCTRDRARGSTTRRWCGLREELEREVRPCSTCTIEPALVEEFLAGPRVHRGDHGERYRPVDAPDRGDHVRRSPAGMNPIYSYEAKWVWDTREAPLEIFDCPGPARIPPCRRRSKTICSTTYRILRCRDWSRIECASMDGKGSRKSWKSIPCRGSSRSRRTIRVFRRPRGPRGCRITAHQRSARYRPAAGRHLAVNETPTEWRPWPELREFHGKKLRISILVQRTDRRAEAGTAVRQRDRAAERETRRLRRRHVKERRARRRDAPVDLSEVGVVEEMDDHQGGAQLPRVPDDHLQRRQRHLPPVRLSAEREARTWSSTLSSVSRTSRSWR